jgi:hypothetical protein
VTERLQCKKSEKGGESVCGKSRSKSKSKSKSEIQGMREDICFVYVVDSRTSSQKIRRTLPFLPVLYLLM